MDNLHPLINKIIEAKLPIKDNLYKPSVTYTQGRYKENGQAVEPTITKSINISQSLYPSITLSDTDFWNKLDKQTLFSNHRMSGSLYSSTNGSLLLLDLYNFESISDTVYQGTISPTELHTAAMGQVSHNPQYYYAEFSNFYTYDDGQHQKIQLVGNIYANFVK